MIYLQAKLILNVFMQVFFVFVVVVVKKIIIIFVVECIYTPIQ